jgi:hypothetical protein
MGNLISRMVKMDTLMAEMALLLQIFPAVLHVAFFGLCCLFPAVLPSVLCTRRLL